MNLGRLGELIDFEFDHVGVAVHSLSEPNVYDAMGLVAAPIEEVVSEQVRVKMYELGNQCRVELLEPTNKGSVMARFLEKRGPGIHHICLRVKDIRAVLTQLKAKQLRLVHQEPFRGAHNCEVAFIHPSAAGGVLVELSQPHSEGGIRAR